MTKHEAAGPKLMRPLGAASSFTFSSQVLIGASSLKEEMWSKQREMKKIFKPDMICLVIV